MNKLKRIGIDILGILLILGSIFFGWLPGPGGIPLFLAGLGLLATNHEWARRLLVHIKENGLKIANAFFREHPLIMLAYDVVALFLFVIAVYIFAVKTGNIIQGFAVILIFLAMGLFLGNRKRIQKLNAFVQKVRHKKT